MVLVGRRALAHAIRDGAANSGTNPSLTQSQVVFNYGRHNSSLDWNNDDLEAALPDGIDSWDATKNAVSVATKGRISEDEIVTLLGIHNLGGTQQLNSGFSGPWGAGADRNRLTNGLYGFTMGIQRGRNF